MTTPQPAALPEPELGYIETDKSRQPAFSARQMRAALQPKPAEVSDAEIIAIKKATRAADPTQPWGDTLAFARAILALRPAQQATPEPVTLGPLAQRNIYDAIRSAYDLGYNDARNARTVPGDSAPGYKGRDVEADHGGALFNTLASRLRSAATPEPVGDEVGWLIEHNLEWGFPGTCDSLSYVCLSAGSSTREASKALRFARREDATSYLAYHLRVQPGRPGAHDKCYRVAEHMWPATPEPVGEPYGWVYTNSQGARVLHLEPSARLDADRQAAADWPNHHKCIPVYTHAPQQVPMSHQELARIAAECGIEPTYGVCHFGRRVEAHYGITAQAKGGAA